MPRKHLLDALGNWLRSIIADEVGRALEECPQKTLINGHTRSALSLQEAAARASISLRAVKSAVASGELRSRKYGRRRLVLPADLDQYLEDLPGDRKGA
jgi:excisionase family DNA binding protein